MRRHKRTQSQQTTTVPLAEYPIGTFLKTEKGYFYVVSEIKRYRFTTKRVLDSWSPQVVVHALEEQPAVRKLKIAAKMRFRNGSLLHCQADGRMYLVAGQKVRHIKSPDILDGLGRKRSDAVWVSEAEINLHEKGEPLE